jgi:hypothetical protein
MKRPERIWWLGLVLFLLVLPVAVQAMPPHPRLDDKVVRPGSMNQIFQEPEKYLDREVIVEGTLEGEGRGLAVTFFLRADSGARLQTDPWAPLEVYHPRESGPLPKSMANYVGRRLRLTGRLQAQGGRIILQVSSVKELP